ncbi:UNKNOWN [Stylonychia lemnae]|uniref:Amino acid transporter transmembrane domain-containing protein n=1 Tax=Stylonychia lemnae TaxID=5949 RepID=A0A078AZA3_STYLE|nr:UNKNOWN [Stylonychia lemnae]|eukprot:CDW86143.1 UNKNOWN [Stylonychia lemnae]
MKQVNSFEIQARESLCIEIETENQQQVNQTQTSNSGISLKKASDFQCFTVSMKLFFGLSYLSIPNTFKLAGVIGGVIMLSFVTIINFLTMNQCLSVAKQFPGVKSYSELGFRVFGKRGKFLVDVTVCTTQLACCIAHQFFSAKSLDFILCTYSDQVHCYGDKLYMLLITIPVIIFSFLGSYRELAYLSIPALFITISGLITLYIYSLQKIASTYNDETSDEINWFNLYAMLGRIGTVMYIFTGNPSIINIQSEAKNYQKYPKILRNVVLCLLVLFNIYGLLAYLGYRNGTQPIFMMSIQPLDKIILLVILGFCFNSMTSYPLQILTAFQIIERLDAYENIRMQPQIKRCLTRSLIIVTVTGICFIVPNFTDFLNISGSVGATFSSFIIPQLLYMKVFKDRMNIYQKIGCLMLIAFGIFGSACSLTFTINRLVNGDNQ